MNNHPTLETHRLKLRPFTLADAPRVQALASDRRVSEMTVNIPYPYENGMAEAWIASHSVLFSSRQAIIYAVVIPGSDELVGTVGLSKITNFDANLGYWFGVPYWGKGYCTEAVAALVEFGFKQFKLPLIYARHLKENLASGRVIQKNGFQHKGSVSIEINRYLRLLEHYEKLKEQTY